MADDKSFVTISGAALSLLIYENVRNVGDQVNKFIVINIIYNNLI